MRLLFALIDITLNHFGILRLKFLSTYLSCHSAVCTLLIVLSVFVLKLQVEHTSKLKPKSIFSPLDPAVMERVHLFNHFIDMTGYHLLMDLTTSPLRDSLCLHHIRVVNTNSLHNTKQSDGVDLMHIEDPEVLSDKEVSFGLHLSIIVQFCEITVRSLLLLNNVSISH